MLAITATGGYFLAAKSQNHDPARAFGTITPAWEAHKPGDHVSEWKHRFKTRRGTEGDLGTILSQGEGSDMVSGWSGESPRRGRPNIFPSSSSEPRSGMVEGGGVVLNAFRPFVDHFDCTFTNRHSNYHRLL